MTVKQKIRNQWLSFLKHYFNPLTLKLAKRSIGPFSIVHHIGRRSKKQYETPLVVGHIADGFVAELTYGPNVDWYKNVLAAGGCTLVWHGKEYLIDKIEPLDIKTGRASFPLPAQLILYLTNRQHYVKMSSQNSQTP